MRQSSKRPIRVETALVAVVLAVVRGAGVRLSRAVWTELGATVAVMLFPLIGRLSTVVFDRMEHLKQGPCQLKRRNPIAAGKATKLSEKREESISKKKQTDRSRWILGGWGTGGRSRRERAALAA